MDGSEQMAAEGAAPLVPPVVLSKGSILSYFNVNNASRVRHVAVWGMFAAGGLAMLEFLWLAWMVLPSRVPGVRSVQDLIFLLEAMVREELFLSLILGAILLEAALLTMCGLGVKRFSQAAAITGIVALVPLIVATGLMTVGFWMAGIMEAGGYMSSAHRVNLLFFVPAVAGVFVILLLKDLVAFLIWILRHPGAEKPAVAFLPLATKMP